MKRVVAFDDAVAGADRDPITAIEGGLELAGKHGDVDLAVDGMPAGRPAGMERDDEPAAALSRVRRFDVEHGSRVFVAYDVRFAAGVVGCADEPHWCRTRRS